ncbi:rhodanese-like domain-containing protein, partial [Georgenia sp.]
FDAQVSVFWSRPTDGRPGMTLRDLFPAPPPAGSTPSCGEAGVLGAMCGQVGSVMAAEAVKLVTGAGDPLLGRVLVLDALGARWTELPVRPRPGATAPTTVAELGYDPTGSPAGSLGAPLCALPAAAEPEPTPVPGIDVGTLARRLAARGRGADAFVLLDVREAAERDIVIIPGAVHVPLAQVLADPTAVVERIGAAVAGTPGAPDAPDAPEILVHCRSGARSARAARALAAVGARATNVDGGVLAWAAEIDRAAPVY